MKDIGPERGNLLLEDSLLTVFGLVSGIPTIADPLHGRAWPANPSLGETGWDFKTATIDGAGRTSPPKGRLLTGRAGLFDTPNVHTWRKCNNNNSPSSSSQNSVTLPTIKALWPKPSTPNPTHPSPSTSNSSNGVYNNPRQSPIDMKRIFAHRKAGSSRDPP
ncbi:hypothetical protein PIB30_075349 [Stylosanthes scabra]|uniref:Uncharacterized protein n=1 Tax=Stylosanthes scabra TaxID=79078 RepID=A0ABU6XSI4_9FABA|nr:hypothetical protein [Stylosanthes scabra]